MKAKFSVEIDKGSGFCFGVVNAINKAEAKLEEQDSLYCLGDIVHNNMEMDRLEERGLKTIQKTDYSTLKNSTVLLRAHGEPPETYHTAKANNIKLIDATCPVVLRLQRSVKLAYKECHEDNGQIVIYGKPGHAEVIGLAGQTDNTAIIIASIEDVSKVDLSRPIHLFSQTTMMMDQYMAIQAHFKQEAKSTLNIHKTICKQVAGRIEELHRFSERNDIIIFVSGKKSSNGKALYSECKKANSNTHMISNPEEINFSWFQDVKSVGVCGATSTPEWLMKEVADCIAQSDQ